MAKFIVHIDGEDIEVDDVKDALDIHFDEDITVEPYVENLPELERYDEPTTEEKDSFGN